MSTYIVQVDALGFAGGVARRGETVMIEQIGTDNVARLLTTGAITSDALVTSAQPATLEPQPDTLQARLSVGLPPDEGYDPTDEEKTWILDVKAGIVPVPFDADKVTDLHVKVLKQRISHLGAKVPPEGNKADYVKALGAAVEAFLVDWEIE